MSRLATNWSNRLIPRNASLRMRTVQASLITSTALATAHSRWASDFRLIVHHNSRFQVATHFILRYVYRGQFQSATEWRPSHVRAQVQDPVPCPCLSGLDLAGLVDPTADRLANAGEGS